MPHTPLPNAPEYTKRTVEDAFGHVRVRGEISGFAGRIPPAIAISR
jgi:exonuclease VII large subunit